MVNTILSYQVSMGALVHVNKSISSYYWCLVSLIEALVINQP